MAIGSGRWGIGKKTLSVDSAFLGRIPLGEATPRLSAAHMVERFTSLDFDVSKRDSVQRTGYRCNRVEPFLYLRYECPVLASIWLFKTGRIE